MKVYLLLGLLLLTGCGFCVDGSGEVVTKDDFVVSYFDSVNLVGSGDVYVTQGQKNSLKVVAEDNILANMKFDVLDKVLSIEQKTCLLPTEDIKIYVTMNDVKRLAISGSGKIISETELNSPDLTIDISGSGDIDANVRVQKLTTSISGSGDTKLKGSADRFAYTVSGSGNLDGGELKTAITDIIISGSGDSLINVDQDLSVKISGSGDVLYSGNAAVTSDISGSGKVEQV